MLHFLLTFIILRFFIVSSAGISSVQLRRKYRENAFLKSELVKRSVENWLKDLIQGSAAAQTGSFDTGRFRYGFTLRFIQGLL